MSTPQKLIRMFHSHLNVGDHINHDERVWRVTQRLRDMSFLEGGKNVSEYEITETHIPYPCTERELTELSTGNHAMYHYHNFKDWLATDAAQRLLLNLARNIEAAYSTPVFSGTIFLRSAEAGSIMALSKAASSWEQMALIDRLVELNVLEWIPEHAVYDGSIPWQQRRLYLLYK
jgi:hypothetical protein